MNELSATSQGASASVFSLWFTVDVPPGEWSPDTTPIASPALFLVHKFAAAAHFLPNVFTLFCLAYLALSDVHSNFPGQPCLFLNVYSSYIDLCFSAT